jgi:tRNA threonylcarbamoyladenosine modification (KEOPS) complex  Pcc1 subunit
MIHLVSCEGKKEECSQAEVIYNSINPDKSSREEEQEVESWRK